MIRTNKNTKRSRLGQSMVEYAVILGAVTLVGLGAFSLLGHKAGDLVGVLAALLPGHDEGTVGSVYVSELIQTTSSGGVTGIVSGVPGSMTQSLGINVDGTLVTDSTGS